MPGGTGTTIRAALALALLVGAARADDGGKGADAPRSPAQINAAFVADARRTFEPFRPKLEALGEWCGTSSLFLQRSRIAETLLAFDPENEQARLWLRFKKQKDGTWQQASARPFSDDNLEALPEWRTRRAEVEDPVREALLPLVQTASWEAAGGRTWLVRGLLAMDPDDAELHDRAGETLVAKRWILKESAATVDGRRSLREAVRKAVQSVGAAKVAHPAVSGWACTAKLDLVAVRANLPPASADEVAVRAAQAIALLRLVLGEDFAPKPDFQILALASWSENASFVARRQGLSADERAYFAARAGYWVSPNEFVSAHDEQPRRVDSVVRQVLDSMNLPAGRVFDGPAWLSEGLGIYLTYALLGTRLTALHEKSSYSNQDGARALADGGDWTAVLRDLVAKGFDPKLPAVLTAPLNSMTKEDTVVAYGLAAYFLEGCGLELRRILERTLAGASVHQAVAETCGVDAAGLQERFVRWLRETK